VKLGIGKLKRKIEKERQNALIGLSLDARVLINISIFVMKQFINIKKIITIIKEIIW